MAQASREFELDTDHFQILLGDGEQGPLVDTSTLWNTAGGVAALSDDPYVVGIGTVRQGGRTRVRVDLKEDTGGVIEEGKYLGDFLLSLPSGRLMVWSPETEDLANAPNVSMEPGRYRGRAFGLGLDEVRDESALEGPEQYRIILSRVP